MPSWVEVGSRRKLPVGFDCFRRHSRRRTRRGAIELSPATLDLISGDNRNYR
jgi:hypothetical protein